MSGIGNGFSSGIERFNNNFLGHTGRRCPVSWSEVKANVSNNVRTCAKACTAFLDSSLGLAVSMGVLGLVTASVCAGKDMLEVITTLPLGYENIVLCFKKQDHLLSQNQKTFISWNISNFGVCTGEEMDLNANETINCLRTYDYKKSFPQTLLPICGYTGLLNKDAPVFMSWKQGVWTVSKNISCMYDLDFTVGSSALGKDKDVLQNSRICQGDHSHPTGFVTPEEVQLRDKDIDCWDNNTDIEKKFEKFFINTTCTNPIVSYDCNTCNGMMIAFGVGSIAVILTTLGTIYKQYRATALKTSKKGVRLAALSLQEGLLISASGLGSSVFALSLANPCSPVGKEVVTASTVLYIASASTRLLRNCITSSTEEGVESETTSINSEILVMNPLKDPFKSTSSC
ncbi:hypothetical protein CLAVI_000596 [Candidatus Clavichlamydia salmonicola]|uniref:hypothetical protein n=1 Tax=Candidatus Clavichlamydia salmonicola TaxID=469812 RepID=UPI001891476F|nr:hypothetical protein [Candidatus Clavichlamydia salmonicola]MBF5050973.1 hypothetical protein [Candidatus Clavichlamydia salmonicola]